MVRLSVHILMIMWAFSSLAMWMLNLCFRINGKGLAIAVSLLQAKKEADIKVFDIFLLCNRNLTVISQLYKQVKWWLKRRWFLVSTDTYTKAENTKFKENPQHLPHEIERPGSKHLFFECPPSPVKWNKAVATFYIFSTKLPSSLRTSC